MSGFRGLGFRVCLNPQEQCSCHGKPHFGIQRGGIGPRRLVELRTLGLGVSGAQGSNRGFRVSGFGLIGFRAREGRVQGLCFGLQARLARLECS